MLFALASVYIYNGRKILLTLFAGAIVVILSLVELFVGAFSDENVVFNINSVTFVLMTGSSMFLDVF